MVAMIHKTKGFVYHHVPKTGGTSIGNWVANNIGNDVYWIGTRGVRTLTRDATTEMFLGWNDEENYYEWMDWWRKHGTGVNHFPPHIQVSRVKKLLRTNRRTKHLETKHFAFLRNPWDWITSLFWHRKNLRSPMDKIYAKHILGQKNEATAFSNFIDCLSSERVSKLGLPLTDPPQSFWINQDVDFIGDFSKLEEDFTKIMSNFGIKVTDFPIKNTQPNNRIVYFWNDYSLVEKARLFLSKDIDLYEKTFNKEATYDRGNG